MRNFDNFFPFIVIGGITAVLVIFAIAMMNWECSSYEVMTGKPTKLTGGSCYVKENGNWYRYDEYKYRFATKGETK